MTHYHQTTQLTAAQAIKYENQASSQDAKVLAYFECLDGVELSPEQVQAAVLPSAPLTSVRRAISNLTSEGKLVKCDSLTVGRYGKPIHKWKLAGTFKQRTLFED